MKELISFFKQANETPLCKSVSCTTCGALYYLHLIILFARHMVSQDQVLNLPAGSDRLLRDLSAGYSDIANWHKKGPREEVDALCHSLLELTDEEIEEFYFDVGLVLSLLGLYPSYWSPVLDVPELDGTAVGRYRDRLAEGPRAIMAQSKARRDARATAHAKRRKRFAERSLALTTKFETFKSLPPMELYGLLATDTNIPLDAVPDSFIVSMTIDASNLSDETRQALLERIDRRNKRFWPALKRALSEERATSLH